MLADRLEPRRSVIKFSRGLLSLKVIENLMFDYEILQENAASYYQKNKEFYSNDVSFTKTEYLNFQLHVVTLSLPPPPPHATVIGYKTVTETLK